MELTNKGLATLCQIARVSLLPGYDEVLTIDKNVADDGMKELQDKKIIEDGKLTQHGLAVATSIYGYSNAKKYIKLGTANFALLQDNEYVMIIKGENYNIEVLNQDQIVAVILSKFTTWNTVTEKEYKKKLLNKNEFKEMVESKEDFEAMYYYVIDLKNRTEKKAIMFISDGYFQHYDQVKEHLDKYPAERVQEAIEGIFV